MFGIKLGREEKTLAAERGRSPSDAASVFGPAAVPIPAAAIEDVSPAVPPTADPPFAVSASPQPPAAAEQAEPLEDEQPFPEEPFAEMRRPGLAGGGKGKGRRLVKAEESPQPAMTPEQRLLILDTWLRSGLPAGDFAALVGMSKHTLYSWKKRFDESGPGGLMDQQRGAPAGSRVHELTKRTILMLKQANPDWGCQRISDMLLRGPALPASAAAVARVLHEAGYQMEEVATHPHPDKPRQFERATPNQLWQTDLFTFVLKRQNRRVYLVAFMDDHSRFITGYGLHASQSAALVLEVVRAAIVAYGTPQEMLTDNGSQYVTWRGTSAFHREMDQRGIKQIVAKPQRPQTLGKIERFWGTLWRECVETSVFLDLEDARRRIGHFIDYYNFQRPHQGIDGLVPADRFFGAASEVLATLRSRVAANALELARNGVPKAPFYVTGRIGERAFSVHAEGERMILKREGQERTEVDLGGVGASSMPLIDAAAASAAVEMPMPVCPDGSPHPDVPEEETSPGESPLDAGLRRLEAFAENRENEPPGGTDTVTTTNSYDQANNLVATTDANGNVTTFAHNGVGDTLSLTDADGNTTSWAVNHLGQTTLQSSLVALGYFPDGTVQTTLATSYDFYDADGNLTTSIDSDHRSITRAYDDLNRETSETWRDASGSQTGTVAYTYDPLGNLHTASNTVGAEATTVAAYTYYDDLANRPLTENVQLAGMDTNVALKRTYDYNGNVATLSANIGGTVDTDTGAVSDGTNDFINTYQYNALGEMTSIAQTSQPATGTYNDVTAKYVALGYDADGRVTASDMYQNPDDSTNLVAHAAYAYNVNSELTNLSYNTATDNSGTMLGAYHFDYNAPGVVGDMYSLNDTDPSYSPDPGDHATWASATYSYDPTGQLLGATYSDSFANPPSTDAGKTYDPNGNRTNVTPVTGTATTTGADNRLLFDGTYTFRYDAEGDRTMQWVNNSGGPESAPKSGDTDITVYTWDNANELVTATHFADWSHYHSDPDPDFFVNYQYDSFGRMVERFADVTGEPEVSENFIYDGSNIVLALADNGNVVERNLTGPAANQVIASESPLPLGEDDGEAVGPGGGQAAGPVNWLLTDNEGTVRDVAQFDGTSTSVADHLVYDAFGKVESQSSSDPANQPTFGYDGTWQDPQTKLNKMGQRWYDARDAVFASYDPASFGGGQTNLTEFVGNSPTNFTDPSGMYPDGYPDRSTPPSGGQGVGDGDGYNCPCCTQAYGTRAGGLDLPEDFDAGGPFEGDGTGYVVVSGGGGGGASSGSWLESYSNWFVTYVPGGGWWSSTVGGGIYSAKRGAGMSDAQIAAESDTALAGQAVATSIVIGGTGFVGGEALLGVGTFGGSAATVATASGTAVAAAETPQGQQAIAETESNAGALAEGGERAVEELDAMLNAWENEGGALPPQVQETTTESAEAVETNRFEWLDGPGEQASAERFEAQEDMLLRENPVRGGADALCNIDSSTAAHVDFMGVPEAYEPSRWPGNFLDQIERHATYHDFAVIDLTGADDDQIYDVLEKVYSLSAVKQGGVIFVGW